MKRLFRTLWNEATGAKQSPRSAEKTQQAPQQARPGIQRAKPMLLAMEQRFMFDGAAVDTAAAKAVADATATSTATAEHSASLPTPPAVDTTAAPTQQRTEVVFVENNIADYQTLVNGVSPGAEVYVLDSTKDGLAQIAQILNGRSGIDAIHILSHGSEATLGLGTLTLDTKDVQGQAAELAAIGSSLTSNGDILLYGCDVAAGSDGAAFISTLATLTGADIAASTDLTGAASKGGDWVLESATGRIEAAVLDVTAYQGVLPLTLVPPTDANYVDTAAVDSFTPDTGTLAGSSDAGPVTYGISGGVVSGSTSTLAGTYGTLVVDTTTGAYTYTPNATAINALTGNATDPFTVTADDGTNPQVTASYTVNITGANDTPVVSAPASITLTDTAAADTFSTTTGTLAATDAEGNSLTYGISGGATGGSHVAGGITYDVSKAGTYGTLYVKSSTGDYIFEPSSDATLNALTASGSDSFTVTASDGNTTGNNTLAVNFTGANDTPVVSAPASITLTDTVAADTFSTTTGTLAATDAEGSGLTYGISGGATGGSHVAGGITYDVSKAGTYGTLYVKSSTGDYIFEPSSDATLNALTASGSDSFTVTASDGNTTGSNTLAVNLTGANDTPTLTTPTAASYTDTTALDTFSNDTGTLVGADRDSGQPLTYGISGGSVSGGVSTLAGTYGTLSVNTTSGAYTYTPNATAINALTAGATDTFTVTFSDGTATANATYTVNITGVDDLPGLATPTAASYTDTAAADTFSNDTGTLAATGIDNGQTANYGINGGTVSGGVSTKAGTYGSLSVDTATGAYTYTPNATAINALTGNTSETFTVTVDDGVNPAASATYTVNITGANDTPTLTTPTAASYTDTVAVDTFSNDTGTLAGTDRDSGQTLTYGITGGTVSGGVSTKVGTYGTLSVDTASGAYTYTPDATAINAMTASTTETFTVTASDGTATATATYTVNLTETNTPPTLGTPTAASYTDTSAADTFSNDTGTLVGADADGGQTLTYGISGGTVSAGTSTKAGTYGSLSVDTASGAYTYTPDATAINALTGNTSETFTVTVTDGKAVTNATYTVNLTGANDTPTLTTPTAASYTDTTALDTFSNDTGTLVGADRDSGQTLTYGISGGSVSGGVSTLAGTYGTLSVNTTSGAYTYTPNATAINALTAGATDTFTVTFSDGTATANATYTVNITGANDAPTLTTPTAAAYTDTSLTSFSNDTGTLVGADRDTGQTLTYGISGGSVSAGVSTLAGTYGTLTVDTTTGAYTYVPNATAVHALTASAADTFTVNVSDGTVTTTATYTVNFTVTSSSSGTTTTTTTRVASDTTSTTTTTDTGSSASSSVFLAPSELAATSSPTTTTLPGATTNTGTPSFSTSSSFSTFNSAPLSQATGNALNPLSDQPAPPVFFASVPEQSVHASNGAVSFSVPLEAFHANDGSGVHLTATQADGKALPSWLSFNAATGKFVGQPPVGAAGVLAIKVMARDATGHEAATVIKVDLGGKATGPQGKPVEKPTSDRPTPGPRGALDGADAGIRAASAKEAGSGRPSLSEQVRHAARHGGSRRTV